MSDRIYLILITLITLYIWRPLLNLVLQWEGYMYLIPNEHIGYLREIWSYPTYFNLQGMMLGELFTRLFNTKMELYFAFELGAILLINICIFFLAKKLLKNTFGGFLGTMIFSTNYFALADINLPNLYAGVFLERLPFNIPLMIISLILLHLYLEKGKLRMYVFSIILYILAIILSRFSIFFSFPFIFYPIFYRFYKSKIIRARMSGLAITIPYITAIVVFSTMLNANAPTSDRSLMEFLLSPQINHYPEAIVRQIATISQIPVVIKALSSGLEPLALSTPQNVTYFMPFIITAYIASFLFVYTKRKEYRPLLLTITCALFAILLLNSFATERLNVFDSSGSSRYFFLPSILISLYWGVVLLTVFSKRYIFAILIVVVFIIVNVITFTHFFKGVLKSTNKTRTISNYIAQNMTKFQKQSLIIIGPSKDFGPYDAAFYTYHLGKEKNILFKTEDISYGDWRIIASASAHVLKIHYNKRCDCVRKEILK